MKSLYLAAAFAFLATALHAQQPKLKPELAGVAFLVGNWTAGRGQVAETGGTSTGSSTIVAAANNAVLLRQDRTNLFDRSGKPTGSFDQIMMIYPEGGTLRADYSDGTHVIHYVSATVTPGKSVAFSSAAQPNAPVFRLIYTLTKADTLSVSFAMAPPGSANFHSIATGGLTRAP